MYVSKCFCHNLHGVNVADHLCLSVFTHASKELGQVTVLPVLLCCDITQSGLSHLPGPIIESHALADKRKFFLSCFIATLICIYPHSQFAVVGSLYSQQPKALRSHIHYSFLWLLYWHHVKSRMTSCWYVDGLREMV